MYLWHPSLLTTFIYLASHSRPPPISFVPNLSQPLYDNTKPILLLPPPSLELASSWHGFGSISCTFLWMFFIFTTLPCFPSSRRFYCCFRFYTIPKQMHACTYHS
ncbi:hypothetical protein BKA70DRAFT_251425 [Coprinopsis sp. MPI-PUGE-AT-0042]|nr:hypothetical protein BKA70DRAFT_251425 [Coprinopsis sp. MPI-PUGE-AT-0042]